MKHAARDGIRTISDTWSENESDLESETELEVFASVNIEDGRENSSHATMIEPVNVFRVVDLTTALAAVCALYRVKNRLSGTMNNQTLIRRNQIR